MLSTFPAAEKQQNAAAAPDATKVNALAWTVPAAPGPMESGTEKRLTEILCLGQSLSTALVFQVEFCRFQGSETIKNDSKLKGALAMYRILKNILLTM